MSDQSPDSGADRALVEFMHEVGHLKMVPRAGWLQVGIRQPESVAEHSYRVGVIAYLIASLEGANADRAATLGVFHDVPECRIGDIPAIGKQHVTSSPAVDVIAVQTAGLPDSVADSVRALIGEFEARETPEAVCAKDADKIECLLQAREYLAQGNPLVKPWVDSMLASVRTVTGKRLAATALEVGAGDWWHAVVSAYGKPSAETGR